MHLDLYGLSFQTPRVTFYLWSPWRAAALEHKLFEVIAALPGIRKERGPDELIIHLDDSKTVSAALQGIARLMKGWQEEADPGLERRLWRWFIEGDTDTYGYDHTGEVTSIWCLIRVGLERGSPEEGGKFEEVELSGFSMRLWPMKGK